MANPTFNSGIDFFSMESGTSNAVKVKSSNENRSKQSTSGPNCYDDAAVVDSWGETAAPTSEYEVVAALSHTIASPKITLGNLIAAASSKIKVDGSNVPVVVGTLQINTQTGSAPTMSVSGQAVQAGASALRKYIPPAFSLTPRHRAQDFLSLCTIKKGSAAANDKTDYGLQSVNGRFPIVITLSQPKGNTLGYDLHGDMATVDFTMNWYASTEPTIELVGSLTIKTSNASSGNTTTVVPTMSEPVAKENPEGGYTQYTWQVSFPMLGFEAS